MFQYAICKIAGKQYKVVPDQQFNIPSVPDVKELSVKVILLVEGDKVRVGNPYLKEELKLKVLGDKLDKKIRVLKYHAKANFRKAYGYRSKVTSVVYSV